MIESDLDNLLFLQSLIVTKLLNLSNKPPFHTQNNLKSGTEFGPHVFPQILHLIYFRIASHAEQQNLRFLKERSLLNSLSSPILFPMLHSRISPWLLI